MEYITSNEARKYLGVCRKFFFQLVEKHSIRKKLTDKKYKIPHYLYSKEDIEKLRHAGFRQPGKEYLGRYNKISVPHWKLPGDVASTNAGLIIHELERIPEVGENLIFNDFNFIILAKEANQLTNIRIEKLKNE